MKTGLIKLALVAAGAVLAAQAFAQPPAQPAGAAAQAPLASPRSALPSPAPSTAGATTVAENLKAATARPLARTAVAAGNAMIPVDDTVAAVASGQILPPAPGFMYER